MGTIRVAFDSRPAADARGVGRYSRCLLAALRETAPQQGEVVETHRPRRADVYHSPWIDGAILRSPCPMVVSIHDIDPLTRPSERLRRGGVYLRLRHLALARATHVIVPTSAVAEDAVARLGLERGRVVVIPPVPEGDASAPVASWSWEDVARATWKVYERALFEPGRAFISTPRAASIRLGPS
jgi:Glycosyltransferase Family 4